MSSIAGWYGRVVLGVWCISSAVFLAASCICHSLKQTQGGLAVVDDGHVAEAKQYGSGRRSDKDPNHSQSQDELNRHDIPG